MSQICQARASSFHPCLGKGSSGTCQPVPSSQGHPTAAPGLSGGHSRRQPGTPGPCPPELLGYPGNSDDIAGHAGKLCPRCAGCHRRCQGNSRRHPAGEVGAGLGAGQCCCPVAHSLGALRLALPPPSPRGTAEAMRRGLSPWGHCHPTWAAGAGTEKPPRPSSGWALSPCPHSWLSTHNTRGSSPAAAPPAALGGAASVPTPPRGSAASPCHLQLSHSLCFSLRGLGRTRNASRFLPVSQTPAPGMHHSPGQGVPLL